MEKIKVFGFQQMVVLLLLLGIAGCGTVERPSKPSASGRAGELLVITEPRIWNGPVGQAFQEKFRAPIPTLNQPEPMFDVIHVPKRDFSKIFETHRHLFMIDVDAGLSSPGIEISRDVYSYPQLVIRIKAPDEETAIRMINNNAQTFFDRYLAVERLRLQNAYRRMINRSAQQAVEEMFGVELAIPEGYFVAITGEDFMWLRKTSTNREFDQCVMIWALDYTDPAVDFDEDVIWARRDSITKKYIAGQFPGTYMTTYRGEWELRPEFREIDFNGLYAIEARSLWTLEGDWMGGPFVNYTFVDEATNRLLMMDGWLFAPDDKKRDFLRQVEAIIWSTRFPDKEEEAEETAGDAGA